MMANKDEQSKGGRLRRSQLFGDQNPLKGIIQWILSIIHRMTGIIAIGLKRKSYLSKQIMELFIDQNPHKLHSTSLVSSERQREKERKQGP